MRKCKILESDTGRNLIRQAGEHHSLGDGFYENLIQDVMFDLSADAGAKLRSNGKAAEREYTIEMPRYNGRVWLLFDMNFDASPAEAAIADCRFIPNKFPFAQRR